jgi:hypothetical protein
MLVVSLDHYIVVVALPEIGRDLGFSDQTLKTVVSAYAIALAGFLLLGGRASDLLGRRRMFVTGLLLYVTGSIVGVGESLDARVILEGHRIELLKAHGIREDVDRDDPAAPDRESNDRVGPSLRSPDDSRLAVD